ncbi:MAG: hypothetical protein U0795_09005 [Pirellulales bacterium]
MKKTPADPEIPAAILTRKGATSTAAVPLEVRQLLDQGLIETVNLCEWLVVDQARLAQQLFTTHGWDDSLPALRTNLAALKAPTAPKRLEAISRTLLEGLPARECQRAVGILSSHRSDVARSWAAYLIGWNERLDLATKFKRIGPLAADSNMGVRETAWMALRPSLAAELTRGLQLLTPWPLKSDPNLRRFASELTRPRGVWCRHLVELKDDPQQALHLLEPLHADSSKYVRDSVANWLNDASKSQPQWVRSVCQRWARQSPTPATEYIVRRALRTING